MHYTQDYSHIPAGPARDFAALQDAHEFLSADRFDQICRLLGTYPDEEFAVQGLSLAGVQGLPARVLYAFARASAARRAELEDAQ